MDNRMNRRNFIKSLFAVTIFPTVAYGALNPRTSTLVEGITPAREEVARAPKVMGAAGVWPNWQYGDFISADHILSAEDITTYKALCRDQAKETFAALQVPDACDKIEYIVQQARPDSGDPFAQWSTIGWKVTIPAPQWQRVLSEHGNKRGYLKSILRTRKRLIPISLNGNTQMIPRGIVRDYLRLVAI